MTKKFKAKLSFNTNNSKKVRSVKYSEESKDKTFQEERKNCGPSWQNNADKSREVPSQNPTKNIYKKC